MVPMAMLPAGLPAWLTQVRGWQGMVVRKTRTPPPPQGGGDKRELISFILLSVTFPATLPFF